MWGLKVPFTTDEKAQMHEHTETEWHDGHWDD